MPPSVAAATATAAYRARLVQIRDVTADAVAAALVAISLDQSPRYLAASLTDWQQQAAELVAGSRLRAGEAAAAYITGYMATVGVAVPALAPPPAVDAAMTLLAARKALLWALGAGQDRPTAQRYGRYVAARDTRGLVGDAASTVLTEAMIRTPRITGWRRVTSATTCQRCAIAAEQVLPPHQPLDTHPGCRCTAEPVVRGVPDAVTRQPATVVAP